MVSTLIGLGGVLAGLGGVMGHSYRQTGFGLWMAGGLVALFGALLVLANWRGVVGTIARQPIKLRYGAFLTRPVVTRATALLVTGFVAWMICQSIGALG